MNKGDIISEIQAGHEGVVVDLYNEFKDEFIKWSNFRFQVSHDDALDVFQDVVINFYESVRSGKLQRLEYKLKTYLFAVGKNMILNRIKYDQRFDHKTDLVDQIVTDNAATRIIESNDRHQIIMEQLKSLGEPCQSILKMFFFQSFTMEAIAQNLDYKNSDVVKSQKVRCMKELRKRVIASFKKEDI